MNTKLPPCDHDDRSSSVPVAGAPGESNTIEAAETEKAFEFSRQVLGEHVPFAVPPERVERTWARLSARAAHAATGALPQSKTKRLTGPVVAMAACAATFLAGVWVGEGKGGSRSAGWAEPRVMSAEPVGLVLPGGSGLHVSPQDVARQAASDSVAVASAAASWRADGNVNLVDTAPGRSANRLTHGGRLPVNDVPGEAAASGVVTAPLQNAQAAAAVTATAVSAPAWQRLAYDGDYEGALADITAMGGFERILQSASAEQLMLLSDVARGTGQQQRALAALRRIVSEHASDAVAPLAALNMGNLLDKMGDGAGATRAFAVYRALSPKGDFAEDALVRQIRSAVSAGEQDLARRLVRQYEVDFPEGRQSDEVARWVEQIPTESEFGDAGSGLSE